MGQINGLRRRHEKGKALSSLMHIGKGLFKKGGHIASPPVFLPGGHRHNIMSRFPAAVHHQGIRVQVEHGLDLSCLFHHIDLIIPGFFCIIVVHKGTTVLREDFLIQGSCLPVLLWLKFSDFHFISPLILSY